MKRQGRGANPLVKASVCLAGNKTQRHLTQIIEMQMKTSMDLKMIAQAGGNIVVTATPYSALDLKMVAAALTLGATLTVKSADKFSALDCKLIASAAPGRVVFDFS